MPEIEAEHLTCPLCKGSESGLYYTDRTRDYFQCGMCGLVFVPERFRLSAEEERARYDLHENDPSDAGYRRFLKGLLEPMAARLKPGAEGLDFGCGPGPTLSLMFAEAGFSCANYDPFYAPDETALLRTYDFVSCSEVIEHCYDPYAVFGQMLSLLKPGGVLGIMTQLVRDREAFARWHYIDDRTHVCFFSNETLKWVGDTFDVKPLFCENSVTLFCV